MVKRHVAWVPPMLAAWGAVLCGLGIHHSSGGLLALALLAALGLALTAALAALQRMRVDMGSVTQARQALQRIAEGDLSLPVVVAGSRTGGLLLAVQALQSTLTDVMGGVQASAADIGHACDGVRHGQIALADRSLRQSAGLQASAASVDEITASVRRNAENVGLAREAARQAGDHADEGSGAVARAVGAMGEVSGRARQIVEIAAMIDGIAFQTNILALNAAVEAARAGEQGRGFAVVAGEVRTLAQRSARAAREIKALIDDAARHIEAGARHVNGAGVSMERLVASVRNVNGCIEGISTATREQCQGIEEANRAVAELDEDTRENHAMIEQAGRTARALQAAVAPLAGLVADFQLPDDRTGPVAHATTRHGLNPPKRPRPFRGKPTATRLPTA